MNYDGASLHERGSKMRYIKLLVALLLALASANVMADWVAVVGDGKLNAYADVGKVTRQENIARMPVLYNPGAGQKRSGESSLLSTQVLYEYDCEDRLYRIVEVTVFSDDMGSGSVVDSSDTVGKWKAMYPSSISETFWKMACGKN